MELFHVDIHIGGRKFGRPVVPDGREYVYDVESNLEDGELAIDDPDWGRYNHTFGTFVNPQHDGHHGLVRWRIAHGDSAEVSRWSPQGRGQS